MKYFKLEEFMCKCGCEGNQMDPLFLTKLDSLRETLGFPFIITSGYRCPEYNIKVSVTGRSGPHTTGRAVDIAADGHHKYLIAENAKALGITRIGIGKTFIHIDDLGNEKGWPDQVFWSY